MTAHRRFFDTQSLTKNVKVITGSYRPDPAAITAVSGKGFAVNFEDVGESSIVFEDKYVDLISVIVSVQHGNATAVRALPSEWNAATKTLTIFTLDVGTGVAEDLNDADESVNNRVNFTAYFQNSRLNGR